MSADQDQKPTPHPTVTAAKISAWAAVIVALISAPWWTGLLGNRDSEATPRPAESEVSASATIGPDAGDTQPAPIFIHPGQDVGTHSLFVDSLRHARGVRPLQPLETGLPIRRVPVGTHFRVEGLEMNRTLNGHEPHRGVRREPLYGGAFEVFKLSDGSIYVLGFATPEGAARVGQPGAAISFSAYPWTQATVAVELPLGGVRRVLSERSIEVPDYIERVTWIEVELR